MVRHLTFLEPEILYRMKRTEKPTDEFATLFGQPPAWSELFY